MHDPPACSRTVLRWAFVAAPSLHRRGINRDRGKGAHVAGASALALFADMSAPYTPHSWHPYEHRALSSGVNPIDTGAPIPLIEGHTWRTHQRVESDRSVLQELTFTVVHVYPHADLMHGACPADSAVC